MIEIIELEKLRFPTKLKVTIGSQSVTDGYMAECKFSMYFYSRKEVETFIKEISTSPMYLEIKEI